MAILVDYIVACEGCTDTCVVEHGPFTVGERPPACSLPLGWNGVDNGRILCPRCCGGLPAQEKPSVTEAIADAAKQSGAFYRREH